MNAAKRENTRQIMTLYGPAILGGVDDDKHLAHVGYYPEECTNDELKARYWRGGKMFWCMIEKVAVIDAPL